MIKYSTPGIKSEGYLLAYKNGKCVSTKRIRRDLYNATQGLIILGTATPPIEELPFEPTPLPE